MNDATATQTPVFSANTRARWAARLEAMSTRANSPTPSMLRKRDRARTAMRSVRALWTQRTAQKRAQRDLATRREIYQEISHSVRRAREEGKDRLFGAIIGTGLACAVTAQIAVALSVI